MGLAMFDYEALTSLEKEIILLIGDDIKTLPIEPHTNTKNRKKLYDRYLKDKVSHEKFDEILVELYFKGLLSFTPANIYSIDNIKPDSRKRLEEAFEKYEKGWKNQDPFIRITVQGERTITGSMVYQRILQDEINQRYTHSQAVLDKKYNKLEKTLS